MDNSIIVGIAENFAKCLWTFPAVALGMWLSTKSWTFYPIIVAGIAWVAYVISIPVYELGINPEVATSVGVAAWALPPILFVVLNIGSIFTIQAMRRQTEVERK